MVILLWYYTTGVLPVSKTAERETTQAIGQVFIKPHLMNSNDSLKIRQLSERNRTLQRANEKLAEEIARHSITVAALLRSEEHYRLLTENASDVVWKLDNDYRFT